MGNKNKNKGGNGLATVTQIGGAAVVAAAVAAAPVVPETTVEVPVVAEKKAKKAGPHMDKVGGSVAYTLPSGTAIQAKVDEGGHLCCPTCAKRLSEKVAAAGVAEKVEARNLKRFAQMQEELARLTVVMSKDSARAGQKPLTKEEILSKLLAPVAVAAEAPIAAVG